MNWHQELLKKNNSKVEYAGQVSMYTPNETLVKRAEGEAPIPKQRIVEMKIELDSWSPERSDPWTGEGYREKLSASVFDAQGPVEKMQLYSYLDHDVSIGSMVGYTFGESPNMKVFKNGNSIIAHMTIDETNPKAKQYADLVEKKVITTNSFIMYVSDVEYQDATEKEIFSIVNHKARLFSIDPVTEGFFPQSTTALVTKNYQPEKEKEVSMKDQNNQTEQIKEFAEIPEPVIEIDAEVQDEEVTEKEGASAEQVAALKAASEQFIPALDDIIKQPNEVEVVKAALNLNTKAQRQYNINYTQAPMKKFSAVDAYQKLKNEEQLNESEINAALKQYDNLTTAAKLELKLVSNIDRVVLENGMRNYSLDGSTGPKGVLLSSTILASGIINDFMTEFPELSSFTQRIPVSTLDDVKKIIFLGGGLTVIAIDEGADPQNSASTVAKVMLTLKRYNVRFVVSNQIANRNEMIRMEEQNIKNAAIIALRTKYYKELTEYCDVAYDADTYTGGIRSGAIVQTEGPALAWSDIRNLIQRLSGQFGYSTILSSIGSLRMHTDTLIALESTLTDALSDVDRAGYKNVNGAVSYQGIQIIASPYYVSVPKSNTGNYPVAFIFKDTEIVYGLSGFSREWNNIEGMGKGQSTHYCGTRGEFKMVDAEQRTRILKLRVVGRNGESKNQPQQKTQQQPNKITNMINTLTGK